MTIKLPTLFPAKRAAIPRRQLGPLDWPHAAEHDYAATLLFAAKQACAGVRSQLLARLPRLVDNATGRFPSTRADARADELEALVEELRRDYGIAEKQARKWALEMLEVVSAQHAAAFASMYGEVLAVNPLVGEEAWLASAMKPAIAENVALITSIPEGLFGSVQGLVTTAVLGGKRVEDLAVDIVNRFSVAESRALLIARDQVARWHGSLDRLRQQDAGVEEYVFSTSRDERVRPGHRRLEGTRQKWSEPPVVDPRTGRRAHPGFDVMCRCQAIAVIPDWEELTR